MSVSAYILFFLIVFTVGFICGMKFILMRIEQERRRNDAFWQGKRIKVLRKI